VVPAIKKWVWSMSVNARISSVSARHSHGAAWGQTDVAEEGYIIKVEKRVVSLSNY
jgi:hypothetical protein